MRQPRSIGLPYEAHLEERTPFRTPSQILSELVPPWYSYNSVRMIGEVGTRDKPRTEQYDYSGGLQSRRWTVVIEVLTGSA